jgi:hypothetical protein
LSACAAGIRAVVVETRFRPIPTHSTGAATGVVAVDVPLTAGRARRRDGLNVLRGQQPGYRDTPGTSLLSPLTQHPRILRPPPPGVRNPATALGYPPLLGASRPPPGPPHAEGRLHPPTPGPLPRATPRENPSVLDAGVAPRSSSHNDGAATNAQAWISLRGSTSAPTAL